MPQVTSRDEGPKLQVAHTRKAEQRATGECMMPYYFGEKIELQLESQPPVR
jgi:hypothetical protein